MEYEDNKSRCYMVKWEYNWLIYITYENYQAEKIIMYWRHKPTQLTNNSSNIWKSITHLLLLHGHTLRRMRKYKWWKSSSVFVHISKSKCWFYETSIHSLTFPVLIPSHNCFWCLSHPSHVYWLFVIAYADSLPFVHMKQLSFAIDFFFRNLLIWNMNRISLNSLCKNS